MCAVCAVREWGDQKDHKSKYKISLYYMWSFWSPHFFTQSTYITDMTEHSFNWFIHTSELWYVVFPVPSISNPMIKTHIINMTESFKPYSFDKWSFWLGWYQKTEKPVPRGSDSIEPEPVLQLTVLRFYGSSNQAILVYTFRSKSTKCQCSGQFPFHESDLFGSISFTCIQPIQLHFTTLQIS